MLGINKFKLSLLLIFLATGLMKGESFQESESDVPGTPYQVIVNHLINLQQNSYNDSLAASAFSPVYSLDKRKEFARELKNFFDAKGLEIEFGSVSRDSNFTDSITLKQEFRLFPKKYPEIYIKKYGNAWYYSEETTQRIHLLYREVFPQWADEILHSLPAGSTDKYLGIALWQYAALGILIILVLLLHYLLSYFVDKVLEKSVWEKIHIGRQHHNTLYKLAKFVSLILLMALVKKLLPLLLLNIHISAFLHTTTDIFQTIFFVLASLQVVSIIKIYLLLAAEKTETKMDDQLIPLLMKSLKIIIAIVALVHMLSLLGVNVTALIAGASIGGLAIALAAQDTFKNLLGSVMIFIDKPFQIGDFITTPDTVGTIEKVGFRTTRIRKIDTSVIAVPNGNLANATITNLGIRKFRIYETNISILYSTPGAQIHEFLGELRKIPPSNPSIQPDTWMIYLHNLAASSKDIYFRVYIEANDFKTELSIREHIIFNILEAAEKTGVNFAYPSSSLYIEKTEVTKGWLSKPQ